MQYKFILQTPADTSLPERIFQVIRVRGFTTVSLSLEVSVDEQRFEFEVSGQRPIGQLYTQLQKLLGVSLLALEDDSPT